MSVKKNFPPDKKYILEYKLSEHQIRGLGAVSAAGMEGKGLRKRSDLVHNRHR